MIYSWNHNTRSTTVADLIKLSFCCSYKTLQRFTLGATLQHPLWRKVSDLENLEKKNVKRHCGGWDLVGSAVMIWCLCKLCVQTCTSSTKIKVHQKIMKHIKIRFSSLQKSIYIIGLVSVPKKIDHCPVKPKKWPSSVSNRNSRHLSTSPANRANVTCTLGSQRRVGSHHFSTTRNQPEEVCEYCVVSRISHHVNCLLYLLGPVISYAPAGCFVAFFKMFSPGTQAMEGRRQAAAPQGLLL